MLVIERTPNQSSQTAKQIAIFKQVKQQTINPVMFILYEICGPVNGLKCHSVQVLDINADFKSSKFNF